jgi:O-acetyl-ADP-ribose deacetylase (regulator of RNase III)
MIEIIKGSLLEAKEKYIAHQCNSVSNQAGGLAYYIFKKFPYADIYQSRPHPFRAMGPDFPGHFVLCGNGVENRFVCNMVCQYYPGSPGSKDSLLDGFDAREKYFERCLVKMAKIPNMESIAFPHSIGCGLAGGNWENYLQMLEMFEIGVNLKQTVRVVIYDNDSA